MLATVGICIAIFVVVVAVLTIFALRRTRRAQVEINDAVAALSRGQLDLASETFTRWSESNNTNLSALARHNLGWTLLRQGRLEEALAVVSNNDSAHERALKRLSLHGTSSADLSLCCALLGKIEDAESWLQVTERRAAIATNPSLPAMRVFARAVLDCRKERCEDAARLLDEQWPECEAALRGSELRPLRVVRAYAHAAAGPRNSGVADNLLASSRPLYDGEFDFLGVAWPAMRAVPRIPSARARACGVALPTEPSLGSATACRTRRCTSARGNTIRPITVRVGRDAGDEDILPPPEPARVIPIGRHLRPSSDYALLPCVAQSIAEGEDS